eukprot:GHVU01069238.1.p1 GENE.GHVU01069238.1~~GHVU01069238.1.p1  ORF type:complete len:704 (+),score=95.05 GHVU01069238.1:1342-3453(+)
MVEKRPRRLNSAPPVLLRSKYRTSLDTIWAKYFLAAILEGIALALAWGNGGIILFDYPQGSKGYILFGVLAGSSLLSFSLKLLFGLFARLRNHSEGSFGVFQLLEVTLYAAWMIAETVTTPETLRNSGRGLFVKSSMNTGFYILLAVYFTISNILLPIRTSTSLYFCIASAVVGCAALLTSDTGREPYSYHDAVSMVGVVVWTAVLAWIGRYYSELEERMSFKVAEASRIKAQRLDDSLKGAGRCESDAPAAVEVLRSHLQEAKKHIELSSDVAAPEIDGNLCEAEGRITEAIAILENTSNLYAVSLELERESFGALAGEYRTLTPRIQAGQMKQKRRKRASISVETTMLKAKAGGAVTSISRIGEDWSLNFLSVYNTKTTDPLLVVGCPLLRSCGTLDAISDKELSDYVMEVQSLYPETPYHNKKRAAVVLNAFTTLNNMLGVPTLGIDRVAVLVAAMNHDIAHPGTESDELLEAKTANVATIYSNHMVLKNFQSYLCFKLLERHGIFRGWSKFQVDKARRLIIELILSTDFKVHTNALTIFKIRRASTEFDFYSNEDDRIMVWKMCIKAANMCTSVQAWDETYGWGLLMGEELLLAGDLLKGMGLTVAHLYDRNYVADLEGNHVGYLHYIVQPLYRELEVIDESGRIGGICIRNLEKNYDCWRTLAEQKLKDHSEPLLLQTPQFAATEWTRSVLHYEANSQ